MEWHFARSICSLHLAQRIYDASGARRPVIFVDETNWDNEANDYVSASDSEASEYLSESDVSESTDPDMPIIFDDDR